MGRIRFIVLLGTLAVQASVQGGESGAFSRDSPETVNALSEYGVDTEKNQTGNIRSVNFWKPNATDSDLVGLGGLPELEELVISGTGITDIGLKQIEKLATLKSLVFCSARISDKGLSTWPS